MRVIKAIVLFWLLLTTTICVTGQSKIGFEWTRVESNGGEFSLLVPTGFDLFSDKEGFELPRFLGKGMNSGNTPIWNTSYKNIVHITAFSEGVALSVSRYETHRDPYAMTLYSRRYLEDGDVSDLKLDGAEGKVIAKATADWYLIQIIAFHKDRIYHIKAASKSRENNALRSFLNSLTIKGQNLFTLKGLPEERVGDANALLSSLTDTAFDSESVPEKREPENDDEAAVNSGNDRMIVYTPKEFRSVAAFRKRATHVVPMRITFAETGRVSKVELVGKDPKSRIGRRAIIAARQIIRLPDESNGKPGEISKLMEYVSYDK